MAKKGKNYPMASLYKQNSILPYLSLVCQKLMKLRYKINYRTLPKPILDIYDRKQGKKTHRYPTRLKKDYKHPNTYQPTIILQFYV